MGMPWNCFCFRGRRFYSTKTDRSTGVICDQAIRLNGFYVSKDYPEHLRRIRFKDPESGKTLVFLTNNTTLPPLTIFDQLQHRRMGGFCQR